MAESRGLVARIFARKEVQDHIVDAKALISYVKDGLVDGVDYDFSWGGASKKNLLKPGAEKVTVFMNLVMKPFIDTAAWEQAGGDSRKMFTIVYLIPYRYQEDGRLGQRIEAYGPDNAEKAYMELAVAVGRGSASLDEISKKGKKLINDHNKGIKMSKKRAFVDGVLTLGLSGEFTQDGEDFGTKKGPDPSDLDRPPIGATPGPTSPQTQGPTIGSGSSGNGTTTAPEPTTEPAGVWNKALVDDALSLVRELPEGLPKQRFKEAIDKHIASRNTPGLVAIVTSLESQMRFKKESQR